MTVRDKALRMSLKASVETLVNLELKVKQIQDNLIPDQVEMITGLYALAGMEDYYLTDVKPALVAHLPDFDWAQFDPSAPALPPKKEAK